MVSFNIFSPLECTCFLSTGCAQSVAEAYKKDRNGFVFEVCKSIDGSYLENVSGLAQFRSSAAEKLAAEGDWDEDDFE